MDNETRCAAYTMIRSVCDRKMQVGSINQKVNYIKCLKSNYPCELEHCYKMRAIVEREKGVCMNKKRFVKTICLDGKTIETECKEHQYRWSGEIPCTGIWCCVLCGKPEADTFNGRP